MKKLMLVALLAVIPLSLRAADNNSGSTLEKLVIAPAPVENYENDKAVNLVGLSIGVARWRDLLSTHSQPTVIVGIIGNANGYASAEDAIQTAREYVNKSPTYRGAAVIKVQDRHMAVELSEALIWKDLEGGLHRMESFSILGTYPVLKALDGFGEFVQLERKNGYGPER